MTDEFTERWIEDAKRAEAQRDQLLAALEAVALATSSEGPTRYVHEIAVAAIAKVQEEPQRYGFRHDGFSERHYPEGEGHQGDHEALQPGQEQSGAGGQWVFEENVVQDNRAWGIEVEPDA